MISKFAIIAFLLLSIPAGAEETDNPFAEPVRESIDRCADKKSDEFLTDEFLKEFEDPRLNDGIGESRV